MWVCGVQLCSSNYTKVLLQWVDAENLPEYLGGTSKATLLDDAGPWQDPKIMGEVSKMSQYRLVMFHGGKTST